MRRRGALRVPQGEPMVRGAAGRPASAEPGVFAGRYRRGGQRCRRRGPGSRLRRWERRGRLREPRRARDRCDASLPGPRAGAAPWPLSPQRRGRRAGGPAGPAGPRQRPGTAALPPRVLFGEVGGIEGKKGLRQGRVTSRLRSRETSRCRAEQPPG